MRKRACHLLDLLNQAHYYASIVPAPTFNSTTTTPQENRQEYFKNASKRTNSSLAWSNGISFNDNKRQILNNRGWHGGLSY